jgi:hypothetical protein
MVGRVPLKTLATELRDVYECTSVVLGYGDFLVGTMGDKSLRPAAPIKHTGRLLEAMGAMQNITDQTCSLLTADGDGGTIGDHRTSDSEMTMVGQGYGGGRSRRRISQKARKLLSQSATPRLVGRQPIR